MVPWRDVTAEIVEGVKLEGFCRKSAAERPERLLDSDLRWGSGGPVECVFVLVVVASVSFAKHFSFFNLINYIIIFYHFLESPTYYEECQG
jgi:hypothetical protein